MKKTSETIAEAFKEGKKRATRNTRVLIENGEVTIKLFGNLIIRRKCRTNEPIILNDCGYQTVTTKDRMNAVLTIYGSRLYIKQIKGEWYLSDGTAWMKQTDNYFYFNN